MSSSQTDGTSSMAVDADDDRALCCRFGADLVLECGEALRLPHRTVSEAHLLLQRFLLSVPRCPVDVDLGASSEALHGHALQLMRQRAAVVGACLFLAGKSTDYPRGVHHIVNVLWDAKNARLGRPREPLSMHGLLFAELKVQIFEAEQQLLVALGFALPTVREHPRSFLPFFLRLLEAGPDVCVAAWTWLNVAPRSLATATLPPSAIACAAITLAAEQHSWDLSSVPLWWRPLHPHRPEVDRALAAIREASTSPAPLDSWRTEEVRAGFAIGPAPSDKGDERGSDVHHLPWMRSRACFAATARHLRDSEIADHR